MPAAEASGPGPVEQLVQDVLLKVVEDVRARGLLLTGRAVFVAARSF